MEYSTALSSADDEEEVEVRNKRESRGGWIGTWANFHEPNHQSCKILFANDQIEARGESAADPLKMTDNEIGIQLEAFVVTEDGLFVAMEPLQSKALAIICINTIWILLQTLIKAEDGLFVSIESTKSTAHAIVCINTIWILLQTLIEAEDGLFVSIEIVECIGLLVQWLWWAHAKKKIQLVAPPFGHKFWQGLAMKAREVDAFWEVACGLRINHSLTEHKLKERDGPSSVTHCHTTFLSSPLSLSLSPPLPTLSFSLTLLSDSHSWGMTSWREGWMWSSAADEGEREIGA
jgi:hypothetical protein